MRKFREEGPEERTGLGLSKNKEEREHRLPMLEARGKKRGRYTGPSLRSGKAEQTRSDIRKCGGHWDNHKRLWLP